MKKPIAPETDQLSSLRAISYHYSADGERPLTDRQRQDLIRIGMRVRFRAHRPGGEAPPIPVFFPLEA